MLSRCSAKLKIDTTGILKFRQDVSFTCISITAVDSAAAQWDAGTGLLVVMYECIAWFTQRIASIDNA